MHRSLGPSATRRYTSEFRRAQENKIMGDEFQVLTCRVLVHRYFEVATHKHAKWYTCSPGSPYIHQGTPWHARKERCQEMSTTLFTTLSKKNHHSLELCGFGYTHFTCSIPSSTPIFVSYIYMCRSMHSAGQR